MKYNGIVSEICNNEMRVEKLKAIDTKYMLVKQTKKFVVGESRVQKIKLSEEDILDAIWHILRCIKKI